MQVIILPADQAQVFQPKKQALTSIIRITEPNCEIIPLKYKGDFYDTLQLSFHDAYIPKKPTVMPSNLRYFDEVDVKKILRFVKKHHFTETMVIHCFAGVSRSPAVALGISWFLGDSKLEKNIMEDIHFIPNPLVLTVFANHLGLYEQKKSFIDSCYLELEDEEEALDYNEF